MTTAEKLKQVAENTKTLCDAARARCTGRHFAAVVTGDGSTALSFSVPFEPDMILISNHDPDIRTKEGILAFCQLDLSAIGQLLGQYSITSGPYQGGPNLGSYVNVLSSVAKKNDRYQRDDNGVVTVQDLGASATQTSVWGEGVDYLVTAVKCIEKSDFDRITEAVLRLPVGGKYNIHICEEKKQAAFTDEQWAALIGKRPTYTFIMA